MAFNDSNNVLFENEMKLSDVGEIKFSMLENKKSGILRAGIREFKHTDSYDGPTKNGMMIRLNTVEEVEQYQKAFNDFFEQVKKMM
jgi:hypothetical protein